MPSDTNTPQKTGCLGKIFNILFIIGLIIAGYYLYLYLTSQPAKDTTNTTKNTTANEETTSNSTGSNPASQSNDAKNVSIVEITDDPLATINFNKLGTVFPFKSVTLVAQTQGNIMNFEHEEGDNIKKGDTIAEISDSTATQIAQINYDTAQKSVKNAEKSLQNTADSVNQNLKNAQIGVQTAQINYNNAVNSYNNLIESLTKQVQAAKLTVQAAEIGWASAQTNYFNTLENTDSSYQNAITQANTGIASSLTLIDNALNTSDSILGVKYNTSNSINDALESYIPSYLVSNARNNLSVAFTDYRDLYNDYIDSRNSEDIDDIHNLNDKTVDLLDQTVEIALDVRSIVNTLQSEDSEELATLKSLFTQVQTSLNQIIPALDEAKGGLLKAAQGLENVITSTEMQPEGALTALESAENQLTQARQGLALAESTYKSQIDNAKTGVELSKKQLESAQNQYLSAKAGGELQKIAAKSQLDQIKGQAEITKVNLESNKIVSPIDGLILEKFIDEGNFINPSQKIVSVANMEKIKVVVSLTQEEIAYVKLGERVTIEAPGGIKEEGMITKVLPALNTVNKKIDVEVVIPNKDMKFKSGMFVDVILNDAASKSNTILIPFKSIIFDRDNKYVYVVENSKAVKKEIKTGETNGNSVSVTDGLSQGDKVITEGAKLVNEGDTVKIMN